VTLPVIQKLQSLLTQVEALRSCQRHLHLNIKKAQALDDITPALLNMFIAGEDFEKGYTCELSKYDSFRTELTDLMTRKADLFQTLKVSLLRC
jgi:ALIX V-shaped domain binding to HIV